MHGGGEAYGQQELEVTEKQQERRQNRWKCKQIINHLSRSQ